MIRQFQIKSNIKDYQVHFVDSFAASLAEDCSSPGAVIVDGNVLQLYQEQLLPILQSYPHLPFQAIETNKSVAMVETLVTQLLEKGFKKNHKLIALGGGITQDMTCFLASTLFRSVPWIFYPTTLLAQCDSCIGSKSSINVGKFKNQIGTFYPPERVTIDVILLRTLNHDDILSGLGEAIKVHYLDELKRYQPILDNYGRSIDDERVMRDITFDSLIIKKRIIEIDEYDRDYRNIMNYGHTFGHALESVTNYEIPHGVAVTIGMGIANYISWKKGMLGDEEYQLMQPLIDENSRRVRTTVHSLDDYWKALQRDKKNIDQDIQCILTKGFGQMFKQKLPLDQELKDLISCYLNEKGFYRSACN